MEPISLAEVRSIGLPKWPGLLVKGDPVSKELAAEIIVRTDSFLFQTNCKKWEDFIYSVAGIQRKRVDFPNGNHYMERDFDSLYAAIARHNVVPLAYLTNSRIATSYVGGSHGWMDWNGTIECGSFNIGKWPSTSDVLLDLKKIALVWPSLSMRCQLLNHESGYPNDPDLFSGPVIEFVMKDGDVQAYRPGAPLFSSSEDEDPVTIPEDFFSDDGMLRREKGCSNETLTAALELAKRATPVPAEKLEALEKAFGYV